MEPTPLDELTRDALLKLYRGSVLTYRQNGGGCAFWFLDGSLIDDGVPLDLLRRGLIAAPPPGSNDPFPLAEKGRELAGRLSQGS
ncbi:MAG TPA: hypothetical protein VGH73_20100 [Thermoanaerobaculia bacterium]|jgi:hypothetical protein